MKGYKLKNGAKGFYALSLTIGSFAIMLCLFELFFYIIDKESYNYNNPDVLEYHAFLGMDNKEDYQTVHSIQKYDRTFVEKTYTIKDGIRMSVGNDDSKEKFLALFGCSYAFGWGCNDDETILSKAALYLQEYNTYNFGVSGSATQHMYWKLKSGKVREIIKENEGLGIYMCWGFHPSRIHMSIWSHWAYEFPYYEYDSMNDDLKYIGKIGELYPYQKSIYTILRKSNTLNHYKVEIPVYTKSLINRFVDQIDVSRKYFKETFINARFIVFIPAPKFSFPKMNYFISKLKEKNIEVAVCREDYFASVLSMNINDTMYPDGHLTPLVQDMLATELCHYLESEIQGNP